MRGNEERLGEDLDLGLLLQSSKDQRVWVEELGDLADLSSEKLGFINAGGAAPSKVGEGYLYPSQKSSRWTLARPETLG